LQRDRGALQCKGRAEPEGQRHNSCGATDTLILDPHMLILANTQKGVRVCVC